MFRFIPPGRRLRKAEVADTATSLSERLVNWALAIASVLFPGLGGTLIGWWTWETAKVAAPFAVGFGLVVAVALRVWWINEKPKPALAEAPTKLVPDAAREAGSGPTLSLENRVSALEARIADAELIPARVQRLLRLRDEFERMNELRDCLEPLADRLILAPPEEFSDAVAWSAAYEEWRGRLEGFWRIASQWHPPAFDPLAVSGDDLTGVEGVPNDERFTTFDSQQQYRTLIVAHRRHGMFAGRTMVRIDSAAQGKP